MVDEHQMIRDAFAKLAQLIVQARARQNAQHAPNTARRQTIGAGASSKLSRSQAETERALHTYNQRPRRGESQRTHQTPSARTEPLASVRVVKGRFRDGPQRATGWFCRGTGVGSDEVHDGGRQRQS